ncbi:hypothetical protein B566_EDAN014422 [Ephemera danica]|nr:hypothetical protein B566_EDAN014422 [Ephemera danica]
MADDMNGYNNGCDEGDFEMSNISEDSAGFDEVISHIQDVLVEEGFQHLLQNFYEKYWREFDYEEENKLHYTTIFQEYVAVIENYMEENLRSKIPGFNMSTFLTIANSRREELEGEVFEVLNSFTDFVTFKELILDYRSVQEGRVADISIQASTGTASAT